MKKIRLVLCRHTQTDLNAQKRYSGAREDVPLNAVGREQACLLAENVAALGPVAIYASDLLRTRQVAEAIAGRSGLAVTHDRRLREVDIGAIGTMLKVEARAAYPQPRFQLSGDFDLREIGGESRTQVIIRQLDCWREILARHGRDDVEPPLVVVVGHGTALRIMLGLLLGPGHELHRQGSFQVVEFAG